ncbi:ParB/RepB/Spo0J family partition protein [Micromonospora sediminicola]|uniref:ParB/RepB/Spo0J family partition protein n=1 Tax=Micromonospora sediminicola TaxID=946078 RepID=A0A1A9BK00_9ACTN|nr:ParB/RepB/Spo0J family partition protein [Micromonospora sediminicola]SBT69284.1 ParB/RepB/Spo0J family partition protein [Micromonospora sediminicola]
MTDSVESAATDYAPPEPAAAVPMQARQVSLASVVTHPANPRRDLGDLTELEESIRELGVLQPPVVLPAARVAGAWPQYAAELAGAEWVVLMGARRRTAAGRVWAGDPDATLNVLLREDAIADDPGGQLDVMTAENTARSPLTPMEEARAFAAQRAAGRSQREIAARMGCSQANVSKRLKLLDLPETMAAAVDARTLEVGEAMAYVDAARGDQEVMLATYEFRSKPPGRTWTVPQAANEVRRERERGIARQALTRKATEQGLTLIDDPYKTFGGAYWDHRLEGKKAIAKARDAGTLVATITDGGLVYYSTAKPKKADNRSESEQKRITDDRERRKAMTARAEAAAVLAARAPKLPPAAADIVDAWLFAPGSECAQLAHKWLLAAEVGPDPALPNYTWWEKVRRAGWHTRVHAAHALALARREVQARATYRSWTHSDAAWLHRLTTEAGYTPSEWEQARLAAIDPPADDTAAGEPDVGERHAVPQRISLSFDSDDACCWLLHYDLQVDQAAAYAEPLTDPDAVDAAQAWAAEVLADRHGIEVTGWTDGQLLPGRPAYLAVHAGDPTAAAGGPGPVGEWRLLFDPVDDAWLLLADDKPHADHDALTAAGVEQACRWASAVLADADVVCHGWTARAAGATLEYVADLTGEC